MKKKDQSINPVLSFFETNATGFAFLIASIATIGSLFFQLVLKLTPCDLCWFQRIFMYPQVIILGVALYNNDKKVHKYSLPLSVIGLAFAVYHYFLQLYPSVLPCTSTSSLCAQKQLELFGFISIPMMSGAAFLLLIILMWLSYRRNK